jgi:hypothetical protein
VKARASAIAPLPTVAQRARRSETGFAARSGCLDSASGWGPVWGAETVSAPASATAAAGRGDRGSAGHPPLRAPASASNRDRTVEGKRRVPALLPAESPTATSVRWLGRSHGFPFARQLQPLAAAPPRQRRGRWLGIAWTVARSYTRASGRTTSSFAARARRSLGLPIKCTSRSSPGAISTRAVCPRNSTRTLRARSS